MFARVEFVFLVQGVSVMLGVRGKTKKATNPVSQGFKGEKGRPSRPDEPREVIILLGVLSAKNKRVLQKQDVHPGFS